VPELFGDGTELSRLWGEVGEIEVESAGSMYKLTAMDDASWGDRGGVSSGVKPCTASIDDTDITPTRTQKSADEKNGTFD